MAIGQTCEVADHDFTKMSFTPSASLNVNIPEKIEEYGTSVCWFERELFSIFNMP